MAHDLLATVDPSWVGGQECQDLELLGRQRHGHPSYRDLPTQEIHLQARELEPLWLLGGHLRIQGLPSEVCPHAAHQLARAERLGYVIVRSDLQAYHDARLVITGREHYYGHVAGLGIPRAYLPADIHPVHTREHDVQNDEVEPFFCSAQAFERPLPIADRQRLHPLTREGVLDDVPHGGGILYYQYSRHPPPPP